VKLAPKQIPDYSGLSVEQLKVIANENDVHIKSGAKKESIVKQLTAEYPFKKVDTFVGPYSKPGMFYFTFILCIVSQIHFLGIMPPFHEFYAENFNVIDRFNRYYYQILYPHKQMESGPVRIWSLLNIAFVQSWTYYRECYVDSEITLTEFVRKYVDENLEFYV
jgi:hypothetical protein